MTSFQKVIKYGAIAFAIYLSFIIIGMIIAGITAIFGITTGFGIFENNNDTAMITKWEQEYSNISNIDVDLSICKLTIKKGNTLKVDASNVTDQFKCEAKGNVLKIEDKKVYRFFWDTGDTIPEVLIYVPEKIEFKEVTIETGMNETYIEYLKADKVELEIGAGKYKIDELLAENANIETGAGEAEINKAEIGKLKLEGGVGRLALTSKILETADIDCGVGKVELKLIGKSTDYRVKTHTGLGNFMVDGQKVRDDETIGNGNVTIKVDAGVGETTVDFIEK